MKRAIVWLRRDLRLDDNVALYQACRSSRFVCAAFVVSPALLRSQRMGAPLVCAFFDAIGALREDLRSRGSDLALLEGDFATELLRLAKRLDASALFYNEDYEPEAIRRDGEVTAALETSGVAVHAFTDHVYFGARDIVNEHGDPYRVYTPYKRRWLERKREAPRPPVPSEDALRGKLIPAEAIGPTRATPLPCEFDFVPSSRYPRVSEARARAALRAFLARDGPVERYGTDRDIPALYGTSGLSPHLRAGTIGIRTCVHAAEVTARVAPPTVRSNIDAWIGELVWRDFYQMVLRRFPFVAERAFRGGMDAIPWRDDDDAFGAWCEGRTGYPIVDAGMRQLNAEGWMHNRLRMITASFLTKHLLIDWRRGERYFEQRLADADMAQNNGGWQWAASTGTDAVPYFRVFNPTRQSMRFDPEGTFVKRWVPELRSVPAPFIHEPWRIPPLVAAESGIEIGVSYPDRIVDHTEARAVMLAAYGSPRG